MITSKKSQRCANFQIVFAFAYLTATPQEPSDRDHDDK